MKKNNVHRNLLLVMAAALTIFSSCKKDQSIASDSTNALSAAITSTQAIAVGTTVGGSTSGADSIYVIHSCSTGDHKDSVSFSSLPAAVIDYLSANYSGYTFQKAFAIKGPSSALQGYVVVIQYSGSPVGLKFDAGGNFIQVLEQREGRDLGGNGFHHGGRFEHRDGMKRDTISFNSLPATVTNYITANYSGDTLIAAFKTVNGGYVVLSKNNAVYSTTFNSNGDFINREELPGHPDRGTAIDQSALPATALTYLSTTYPGYVFEKALSISFNGTQQGYVVVIDANGTKYAVAFDVNGNFIKAKTIR